MNRLIPRPRTPEERVQHYATLSPARYERLIAVARRRQMNLALVAENVHDPHNVSAMARTAEAVGVGVFHLLYTREQFPRLHKLSAQGSDRWLLTRHWIEPERMIADLRAAGLAIYTTSASPPAQQLYEIDFTRPAAIIVGNEHRGVSEFCMAQADARIHIPMMGMTQSLNVSVATAVVLYEAMRQRLQTGAYDREQLDEQQQELVTRWIEREYSRITRANRKTPRRESTNRGPHQ